MLSQGSHFPAWREERNYDILKNNYLYLWKKYFPPADVLISVAKFHLLPLAARFAVWTQALYAASWRITFERDFFIHAWNKSNIAVCCSLIRNLLVLVKPPPQKKSKNTSYSSTQQQQLPPPFPRSARSFGSLATKLDLCTVFFLEIYDHDFFGLLLLIVFFLLSPAVPEMAVGRKKGGREGENSRRGRNLFKKSCYSAKGKTSRPPSLPPSSKTCQFAKKKERGGEKMMVMGRGCTALPLSFLSVEKCHHFALHRISPAPPIMS